MNKLHCPHLRDIADVRTANLDACADCNFSGPNLWVCLQRKCQKVGCSEQNDDHSTLHYQQNHEHCVHMNLSSRRLWCFECEREVFAHERNFVDEQDDLSSNNMTAATNAKCKTGLVGLENIGNTCYMNSALQALSNVRPMTYYFLNCGDLIRHAVDKSLATTTAHRSKAGLAKSYQSLVCDVWLNGDESKDYIRPRDILFGIRSVNPMFRGFQQHDTQEFLRCFMDQLHEELKAQDPTNLFLISKTNELELEDMSSSTTSSSTNSRCSSSLSMEEYETCESSLSVDAETLSNTFPQNKPSKRASLQTERYAAHSSSKSTTTTKNTTAMTTAATTPTTPLPRSIISDIFDGKLLSSVQCLTCDRVSTREETFQDLSLPIPNRDYLNVLHQTHSASAQSLNLTESAGKYNNDSSWLTWIWSMIRSWLYGPAVTLHDCMASFFSADELKGDNMYSCEKCNKLRTGIKYSQILDLPEVLCIHLKRFRHDLSYSSKISSHVHFPLEGFDMRPYLHKDCNSNVSMYNLSSIICHHGTVGGGHYTCIARNALNNRWYEYDDHRVSEVSADAVQNCQAYVLFYHKHNPQMERIRAEANNISMANPLNMADIRFYVSREWLVRFNTFAEPGPIDNWSILCPHGGILQSKIDILPRVAVPIAQPLWDFFYAKYGGGPALNVLFECDVCKREAEALAQRRLYELSTFTKYNGIDADVESCSIFAISMPWLRKWQQFVRGTTNKEPGPIANGHIASTTSAAAAASAVNEHAGNVAAAASAATLMNNVRSGSDYAQLNAMQWRLLYQIYGGGPIILLRGSLSEAYDLSDSVEQDLDVSIIETTTTTTTSQEHMDSQAETAESDFNETRATTTTTTSSVATADLNHDVADSANGNSTFVENSTSLAAIHMPHSKSSTNSRHQSHSHSHQSVNSNSSSSNAYHIGYNKMKPKANAFRKRSKRSRNAMKNAEFFGPKGHYNMNSSNEMPAHYETHSTNDDAERSDSGVSVNQSRTSAPPIGAATAMPAETKADKRHSRRFGKIPLTRSSTKVYKSKSQESVVTLKKFVTLHDSNDSFETDA